MAEYVEVMEQKRRMCNSYALCSMGCSLNDIDFCNKHSGEKINADFSEVERRVMEWAAEHPEPKYPTWYEVMAKLGVINGRLGDRTLGEHVIDGLIHHRIPADIAQKLGIEPKVGA